MMSSPGPLVIVELVFEKNCPVSLVFAESGVTPARIMVWPFTLRTDDATPL
jgi:hypothetical protein